MGISKVIFFLHCTGLALLSSCVFAGAFNVDTCNHTAIKLDFQNILQNSIKEKPDKPCTNVINCCPLTEPKNRTRAASLLDCIHAFTAECAKNPFNSTERVLDLRCNADPAKNGTQNVEVSFRKSQKCKNQRAKNKCGSRPLCELEKMWKEYMRA